MNPALDITTDAGVVRPTNKIRCSRERYDAGGGGINVARVASALGVKPSAAFPVGGSTGEMIENMVVQAGVAARVIRIAESTCECFTVNEHSTGKQYRFVLPGPCVSTSERAQCLDELRIAMRSAEFVVAGGSLPPSVPAGWYQRVADVCRDAGVLLVLDTSGGGVTHVTSGVFLLKASLRELGERLGRELATESEQVAAARELIDRGVTQSVVVSRGSRGALLVTPPEAERFSALPVRLVSGVGAGDAMVAGIVVAPSRARSLSSAVRFGAAAGTAMLLTPGTAAPIRSDVERLHKLVPEPTVINLVNA